MAETQDQNAEQTPPPVVALDTNNAPAQDAPDYEQTETGFDAAAAFEQALAEKDKKAAEPPAEVKPAEPKADTPPPAPDAKAAEPKVEEKPADTTSDEEVFKDADEISRDPHAKERTRKRIKETVAIAKREAALRTKEVGERDARIKELEDKVKLSPSNTAELEQLKKQAEEATAKAKEAEEKYLPYRRQYEVEKSPELEERFVKPVKAAEETIKATLKGYGLGDATLAEIEKAGGLAAFSKSNKTYQLKDADGEPVTVSASQVVSEWVSKMNFADAEKVRSLVGEQEKLNLQRGLYIDSERSKAKEYFEGLSKREQEQAASFKAQQDAAAKEVKEWLDTQFANDEHFKEKDGEDNAPRAEAKQRLLKYLSGSDRPTLLNAARDAAILPLVRSQLAAKDTEIAALKKQLADKDAEVDKVRSAGASIPKNSGRTGSGTAGEGKKANPDEEAIIRGSLSSAEIMARSMGA